MHTYVRGSFWVTQCIDLTSQSLCLPSYYLCSQIPWKEVPIPYCLLTLIRFNKNVTKLPSELEECIVLKMEHGAMCSEQQSYSKIVNQELINSNLPSLKTKIMSRNVPIGLTINMIRGFDEVKYLKTIFIHLKTSLNVSTLFRKLYHQMICSSR